MEDYRIEQADAVQFLRELPADSVQCCVTSPPYFGLRDYGHPGQIGTESTPAEFVARLVGVFREVRRVLKPDGVAWVNIGDSYAGSGKGGNPDDSPHKVQRSNYASKGVSDGKLLYGLKHKDMIGIPWMLAFAMRDDGWYLRSEIIWHKPNPMPESVTDRPTKAHEQVFLFAKSTKYFYDAAAIAEKATGGMGGASFGKQGQDAKGTGAQSRTYNRPEYETRNKRSVWTVLPEPYHGAHFAVMPTALVRPCILAGSRPGDVVLDPFIGSGTVAAVAVEHGRKALGCELNPKFVALALARLAMVTPDMFATLPLPEFAESA